MKLLITQGRDGVVLRVGTVNQAIHGKLKTEADVLEAVEKSNKDKGFDMYIVKEVDGIVEEAFAFLVGDKGYKVTYDIEDICDRTDEVKNAIESLSSDVYDVEQAVNTIKELVGKLKEKEND